MAHTPSLFDDLRTHYNETHTRRIADLFASDSNRFSNFSIRLDDILFDYSKTNIDSTTLSLLFSLLEAIDFSTRRTSFFSGESINTSEGRAVQHMAYRNMSESDIFVNDKNIMSDLRALRSTIFHFADSIRTQKQFSDIVHIGIGGSHLGPAMTTHALQFFSDGPIIHYVSNIDATDLHTALESCDPSRTLFTIASKTFTTTETMTNAHSAKDWLCSHLSSDSISDHFVALTGASDRAESFGIATDRIFDIPDWIGGRFSIWSSMGLPLLFSIGSSRFIEFLEGASHIDSHFLTSPVSSNIPVLQALISIWHHTICGYTTHAILPYDERLTLFPSYLRQLCMESNGKSVSLTGERVSYPTTPVLWGDTGTDGQHSFHQFLHQGTSIVPVDFLVPANPSVDLGDHHSHLISNAFAQSESLMVGRTDSSTPHNHFDGNRPSCMFLYSDITPYILGQLIALFEHKVFVEGLLWNINSFDQWGVELGKSLSSDILPCVKGIDSSVSDYTEGLLAVFREMRHKD